ncbi:hypothetical protein ABFS83_09G058000 [Erythranthe nasuta]
MDETPALSTSDKPPIPKLGLGLLIPDAAPFDPTTTAADDQPNASDSVSDPPPQAAVKVVMDEEISTTSEEAELELGISLEKELFQLAIFLAEMEAASMRLEAIDAEEEENGFRTVEIENFVEGENGKDSERVEEANEGGDEGSEMKMVEIDYLGEENNENDAEIFEEENENAGSENDREEVGFGEEVEKLARPNHSLNRRKINYPTRPDAEDCAFYMKFGSCKFGTNCKFNHPPRRKYQGVKERANHREENSEKAGQTECKYHFTSVGCRYGKDCKYSHGPMKSSTFHNPAFNFLGLPIRPGEKECPYYLRTGSCKYGSNCRFHHPEPKTVPVGGGSPSGYDNGSSWSSPRALTNTSPFVPVVFPSNHGTSTPNQEWNNGYQGTTYPTSERSLPTPPAFAINNLPTEINFPMQQQHGMAVEEYPERPGEPECSFFIKTGDCKFKFNCKFNHPKNRNPRANSFSLNDQGLPLRPDQPICTHYHRYGICKYGPACKYDHSMGPSPPPFVQPPAFDRGQISGAFDRGQISGLRK